MGGPVLQGGTKRHIGLAVDGIIRVGSFVETVVNPYLVDT
jgi:hypothetical protein